MLLLGRRSTKILSIGTHWLSSGERSLNVFL
jgi:hypothetical protein